MRGLISKSVSSVSEPVSPWSRRLAAPLLPPSEMEDKLLTPLIFRALRRFDFFTVDVAVMEAEEAVLLILPPLLTEARSCCCCCCCCCESVAEVLIVVSEAECKGALLLMLIAYFSFTRPCDFEQTNGF